MVDEVRVEHRRADLGDLDQFITQVSEWLARSQESDDSTR